MTLNMSIASKDDEKYWISWSILLKSNSKKLNKLANYFVSMKEAWQANLTSLINSNIKESDANQIIQARSQINPDQELKRMVDAGVMTINITEKEYPPSLKEIYDPPALLYYRGSLRPLSQITLAIVGTRKYSPYGKRVTEDIISQLNNNITIASGLALGIDTITHCACLKHSIPTVAVLGGGIDKATVAPKTNQQVAENIIKAGGCVISEYPFGFTPNKFTFPARNRILAGLSVGTLVIEAQDRSGSLITARCAIENNREVFAIPGDIYSPNSVGTNKFIKLGARLVTSAEDLINGLNIQQEIDFGPKKD
jgi:DNA processing protein